MPWNGKSKRTYVSCCTRLVYGGVGKRREGPGEAEGGGDEAAERREVEAISTLTFRANMRKIVPIGPCMVIRAMMMTSTIMTYMRQGLGA